MLRRNIERQTRGRADRRSAGTGVTDGDLDVFNRCHLGAISGVHKKEWLHAAVCIVEASRARAVIMHTGEHV